MIHILQESIQGKFLDCIFCCSFSSYIYLLLLVNYVVNIANPHSSMGYLPQAHRNILAYDDLLQTKSQLFEIQTSERHLVTLDHLWFRRVHMPSWRASVDNYMAVASKTQPPWRNLRSPRFSLYKKTGLVALRGVLRVF